MATPEPRPIQKVNAPPIQRVNSGSVIVYDLASQTIKTENAEEFKGIDFDRYARSYANREL